MNLILGKSKTGKSKYIFDKMDNDILLNKEVIYFVPSQMRVLSEENYINFQNKPGIIDINITTINSYIKDFLSEYNLNFEDKYVSKLDRKLILTKIMLENPKLFNIFKKVKNKEGFLENLNIYMDIFKKEEIDIDKMEKFDFSDKLLEYKLKEITNVYKKYIEYTSDKYIDDIDEVDIFCKLFEEKFKNKDINNIVIYFDAYNNFTNHEFKFIKILLKLKFNLTFSITTDISDKVENISDYSINELSNILNSEVTNIFTQSNMTLITLLKYAKKENLKIDTKFMSKNYLDSKFDIKYLSNNIFTDNNLTSKLKVENIHINLTTNIYSEVLKIANVISEKIREGYRYKDFVIYTSSPDEYSYVIRKIFYDYNIPVYIDSKISIESNILIKYLQKLIEICKTGYKKENIFEILKLGLCDITFEDISYIENYTLEFNSDRYRFERDFTYNNLYNGVVYDLERLNNIRKRIVDIFKNITEYTKIKHISIDIVREIYNHLVENKILENYSVIIDEMKNSSDPTIKYNGNVGYQMWDKLSDVFSSITKIYDKTKLSILDFSKILKYSLKDIKVKNIEPTYDEVQVLCVGASKCITKKIIFIVGVNENKLPEKIQDDLFFDDLEIDVLQAYDIKFKETSLFKLSMQLYNIYEIINNVTDMLQFSYLSSDTSGKSLRPSNLIMILDKLLDIQVKGSVISSDINSKVFSKKAVFEKLMHLINSSENITEEILTLYSYIMKYSDFNEILKYVRENNNLDDKTMNDLNKNDFVTSVSKLELFQKCPFSYFMKYGLKLNERKIYEITSLDKGSFMHNVLEKFSMYLFENNINWHEILLDKDKYIKILGVVIDKQLDKTFTRYKENVKYVILKQKLKNTMNKVIITIAQSFNQSKFIPYGYEIEFKDGGLFAPIEIDLGNNKKMNIIGKIDRIDTLKVEDTMYARVVDYKSSSKKLTVDDIKEGLSLQLITYLSSFINNIKNEKVVPAGMVYFTLSEKLVNIKEYTDDENKISKKIKEALRMKGIFIKDIEILSLMDNKINNNDRLIDVSARTVKKSSSTKSLLEKEKFENLCIEAKDILKNIGNDIISGNASINPNKKADYCKYCEFSSICRKENLC